MTIKQLREWLFQNEKTNEWWVNIDGETREKTFNLESIELFCSKYPTSRIMVLHISHLENLGEPPWIDVDYAPSKPHLTQQNSTYNPEAAPPPPPPPPPPRDNPSIREQVTEKIPTTELPTRHLNEVPRGSGVSSFATTEFSSTSQKKDVLRLLFSFKGRINRKQFLLGYAVKLIALLLLGAIIIIINPRSDLSLIILMIPTIAIIWLNFSLLSRRLKDTNTSPAILVLLLIPYLNVLIGLVIMAICAIFSTSKRSEKKYGPQYDIF